MRDFRRHQQPEQNDQQPQPTEVAPARQTRSQTNKRFEREAAQEKRQNPSGQQDKTSAMNEAELTRSHINQKLPPPDAAQAAHQEEQEIQEDLHGNRPHRLVERHCQPPARNKKQLGEEMPQVVGRISKWDAQKLQHTPLADGDEQQGGQMQGIKP